MAIGIAAISAVGVAGSSTSQASVAAEAEPDARPTQAFTVFTNERYANRPGLEQYGAVRATVVYDQPTYTCDDNGCYSDGGPLWSEEQYKAMVRTYASAAEFGGGSGGPIVLDFEAITLNSPWLSEPLDGQAATNAFELWRQLITWTKEAVPGVPVGQYAYDWETTNNDLIAQLHQDGLFDFFAPRAYWDNGTTQAEWTARMDAAVANDQALAPDQPIYPYIHTKYIGGGPIYGNDLAYQINYFEDNTSGLVMWEPNNHSTADDCRWVSQFSYEMGVITGTSSSGPLSAAAKPPSGSCLVPRGTTSVPVTLTNTSDSTTDATQLDDVAGAQGTTGTWSDANVPSLAPGESFETTLNLSIPSTEDFSTLLLHIETGISDTRWAVIVQ